MIDAGAEMWLGLHFLEVIMVYCALARTWRPQSFTEFVGQQHAVSALQKALSQSTLHHAYLFTGTRGVGKTSIARLFAKSLSCSQGVVADPCGTCQNCQAISQGRYLDLIEIDAASRTKVEDTRELLSQVTYPPAQGRYKIYLIDEVHMLSQHSFNALLKTLEEPPLHVKFLLATTDPQKLPITIQSRCLQFHLQHLSPPVLAQHLEKILTQQGVPYDTGAVELLAQHAHGSMRDAISLLEQALASTGDHFDSDSVSAMLGTLPTDCLHELLGAIIASDRAQLSAILQKLNYQSYDYFAVIDQLIALLCEIGQHQLLATSANAANSDATTQSSLTASFSDQIDPEKNQTYLTLLLDAKKNLDLYPDHAMGFASLVMRLLCFSPDESSLVALLEHHMPSGQDALPLQNPNALHAPRNAAAKLSARDILAQKQSQPASHQTAGTTSIAATPSSSSPAISPTNAAPIAVPSAAPTPQPAAFSAPVPTSWTEVTRNLSLSGMQKQVLSHSSLANPLEDAAWTITVPKQYQLMLNDSAKKLIADSVPALMQRAIAVKFVTTTSAPTTTSPPTTEAAPTAASPTVTHTPSEADTQDPKLQSLLSSLDATVAD